MLPVFIMTTTAGLKTLSKYKISSLIFSVFYIYFSFSFVYFYFSHYRYESAIPFHWGFEKVAQVAIDNSSEHERVIIDLTGESALMAYLVQSKFDPALLHSLLPLKQVETVPSVSAVKFDNIYILSPGNRAWGDYYLENKISPNTLLILSANNITSLPISETLYYPNGQKAFYLIRF